MTTTINNQKETPDESKESFLRELYNGTTVSWSRVPRTLVYDPWYQDSYDLTKILRLSGIVSRILQSLRDVSRIP